MIQCNFAIGVDFVVGGELTVYEWCMIYTDRDPRVVSQYPDVAGQKGRLQYLGSIAPLVSGPMTAAVAGQDFEVDVRAHYRIANAVYQELAKVIQTGELRPKRRAYLEDRPGELDPTLCVLDGAAILEIAERRGDGGQVIRKLLVAHQVRKQRPGPKAGAVSIKDLAWEIALRILNDEAQRPPRGHGRLATLAGMVNVGLTRHGHQYKDDSVRKTIGPSLRDWEAKNPQK
jgi:hypothetical protein